MYIFVIQFFATMIKSFTDLEAYKACRLLRKNISTLVKTCFPPDEKFRLSDQILRSSRSTTACLAEGYGRFSHKENIQFCRFSRGSLEETLEHLITAFDEGYIDAATLKSYKEQVDECTRLLNGYIRYLQKA